MLEIIKANIKFVLYISIFIRNVIKISQEFPCFVVLEVEVIAKLSLLIKLSFWGSPEIPEYRNIRMALQKAKMHNATQLEEDGYIPCGQTFSYRESFQAAAACRCLWKLKNGFGGVRAEKCGSNSCLCWKFCPFCSVCSIFFCRCVRRQGFPHERRKFSSLFVEAVGEVFGACCSFVLSIKSLQNVVEKTSFYFVFQKYFFPFHLTTLLFLGLLNFSHFSTTFF